MTFSGSQVPGRWLDHQLMWAGHLGLLTLGESWHPNSPRRDFSARTGLGQKGASHKWPSGFLGQEVAPPDPVPSPSQPFFTEECKFKEILLPNNYNAYECYRYPGMFIALSKNGKTKKGSRVSPTMKVTHFLPRL